MQDEGLPLLVQIEQCMKVVRAGATPKTQETLALLQRVIDDNRKQLRLTAPDPAALEDCTERIAVGAK